MLCIVTQYAQAQNNNRHNIAYQDNMVRFTLITEGTVRMEYVPDGKFVDNKSLVAVIRDYPDVKYSLKNGSNYVEIKTSVLSVRYKKGSGKFSPDNITISSAKGNKTKFAWKPGMKDDANLKGTYRTLDGYDGNMKDGTAMPIEDGLLSRNGWTLIDDSKSYLFDNSEWPWIADRPERGNTQDWYFMAYGHDYKKALKDFTIFAGKVPLPPRYAFGYWWSRYWAYSDHELRDLVNKFNEYDIPLDVLVIDMDWHYTEAGKGGWTGYTWNRRLFPNPDGFLKWLKSKGLQITLNLHPADGIKSYEEHYAQMAQWMGMDSLQKIDIPWQTSDKKFMSGWLETQLRPMEKSGVDFWWLDWQQKKNDNKFADLSNTWWINYAVFSDMQRNRETRPMLYHRWGGLGNHRYQIGFSGDSEISWNSLDFQPYFNSTASNVLYGYWSHDIGGHMGASSIDPEMYVRWMQFGALSPILRTHSTKNAGLNKEPWVFDSQHFDIICNIIRQRYAMAPYIYTMARKTHDTGVSLCRPMYYDYAESQEAYDNKNEYMFGDDMLVYPITSPMKDGISEQKIWLPAGNSWYETATGSLLDGGQTVTRTFHIDEYPIYVKAGSIIPENGDVKNLKNNDEPIRVCVFPGEKGAFDLYEDNGNDKDYENRYATTHLASVRNGNRLTVTISPRIGRYDGMPDKRKFTIKVIASAVPQNVTYGGKSIEYDYDGAELSLYVDIPETDCSVNKEVVITYPDNALTLTDGIIGKMRHIRQNVLYLKKEKAGIVINEELGTMASVGEAINYNKGRLNELVSAFRRNYDNLPSILKANRVNENVTEYFLKNK